MMKENNPPLNILVIDDEANIRKILSICLETEGYRVTATGKPEDALAEASRRSFDIAFVDIRLGTVNGLDLIPALLATSPWLKIIMITAYASIDTAVESVRRGAADYIPKPFTPAQITLAVKKVFEVRSLEQKVAALREDLGRSRLEEDFSTTSSVMERALDLTRQTAPSDATILLRGESGTGKSVLAKAIHTWSRRASMPFSVLSCPSHLRSSSKASSLDMSRAPLPAPYATMPVASAPATAGRSFWMKSVTFPFFFSLSSCVLSRTRNMSASVIT